MPDDAHAAKQMWVGIGKLALSFLVGAFGAVFLLGGREAKITGLQSWREKTEPRIERMDSVGTLSFELFHKEYERNQARLEAAVKELEKEMKEIQKKSDP